MNTDYKILAKIIMNRLNDTLENIIEKEQTCAIKGRLMWDNLCTLRETLQKRDFFIIGLDQKKAFDYISRDYLWSVLEANGFPNDFIHMIQCLYRKSCVRINVNGVLTDSFNVERGVKPGCPLSAALYILAISPLIKIINADPLISGQLINNSCNVKAMAYADDVTVIIKNQLEMDILINHLCLYELASGAKLNHEKTEGVWIGTESKKPHLNIQIKEEIKILGLTLCHNDCSERNWDEKLNIVKEEINKWRNKDTNYKSRINIMKTYILSKLLFLANIFPPTPSILKQLNKQCVNMGPGNH